MGERNCRYACGGYAELRQVYSRSAHFDVAGTGEPRRLHLGLDVWGEGGTPVYAPLGGLLHSFGFNNHDGDYGATIILSHSLDGLSFYTLYGHLSLDDIAELRPGAYYTSGELVGHFGGPKENGNWPPHLHFQLIADIGLYHGDYPGVCRQSEAAYWLGNSPDPSCIFKPV